MIIDETITMADCSIVHHPHPPNFLPYPRRRWNRRTQICGQWKRRRATKRNSALWDWGWWFYHDPRTIVTERRFTGPGHLDDKVTQWFCLTYCILYGYRLNHSNNPFCFFSVFEVGHGANQYSCSGSIQPEGAMGDDHNRWVQCLSALVGGFRTPLLMTSVNICCLAKEQDIHCWHLSSLWCSDIWQQAPAEVKHASSRKSSLIFIWTDHIDWWSQRSVWLRCLKSGLVD